MRAWGAIAALFCLAGIASAAKITVEKTDEGARVLADGQLFANLVVKDTPKPYLYPIIGPTGAQLTRGFPMNSTNKDEEHDHPHHRSLWFAHGDVNGADFWLEGEGKATFKPLMLQLPGEMTASGGLPILITGQIETSSGKAVASCDLMIRFSAEADWRAIDYFITVRPAEGVDQLTFGDTKEGTMAIRTHPALRLVGKTATGKAVNSEGVTGKDVWGKRAKWVDYWGQIDGQTAGVAIFDHPSNPRHPTWWHARDYGLIAANPFGQHDFEGAPAGSGNLIIRNGDELNLRYRFFFHKGDVEEGKVAAAYARWSEPTPLRRALDKANSGGGSW